MVHGLITAGCIEMAICSGTYPLLRTNSLGFGLASSCVLGQETRLIQREFFQHFNCHPWVVVRGTFSG